MPRLIRAKRGQLLAELNGGLTDDQKLSLHGSHRLGVLAKALKIHTRGEIPIMPIASEINREARGAVP
ncbi:MAG: hypothetical protein ABSB15_10945 [Bryobacteraceae bacterium]